MKGKADARLLAAATAAVVLGASAYAAIGAALGPYSPGPLALVRMLVASAAVALYAACSGMRLPEARDLPAVALAGLFAFALYGVAPFTRVSYGAAAGSPATPRPRTPRGGLSREAVPWACAGSRALGGRRRAAAS